jgi:hypothetical protein
MTNRILNFIKSFVLLLLLIFCKIFDFQLIRRRVGGEGEQANKSYTAFPPFG